MPIGIAGGKKLPFINQSISRQLRSGVFRSKTPIGPETTAAITEGTLASASSEAIAQANIQQQAEAEANRLQENKRASKESERLNREQLTERARLDDQRRQDVRKQRKREEAAQPGFFEGLLGS